MTPLDCHDGWVSIAPGADTAINERHDIVTSATQERSRVPFLSFTTWSLLAIGGGLALGILGHASPAAPFALLGTIANVVGELWISALQMVALPLAAGRRLVGTEAVPVMSAAHS